MSKRPPETPNLPLPDPDEREVALVARLLGETPIGDATKSQAEDAYFAKAIDCLASAINGPSHTAADAPEKLSSDRRANLLKTLQSENPKQPRGFRLLDFSQPLYGLAAAACLTLVIGWQILSNGVFHSPDQTDLHKLRVNTVPPPVVADQPDDQVSILGSSGTRGAPELTIKMLEKSLNPSAGKPEYISELDVPPNPQLEALTFSDVERRRQSDSEVAEYKNLQALSQISVGYSAPQEAPAIELDKVYQMSKDESVASHFRVNSASTFSEPADARAPQMLFGGGDVQEVAQAAESEEIFELSPFEVTSAGKTGYRVRSTLAGSRIRTETIAKPSYGFSVGDFGIDADAKEGGESTAATGRAEPQRPVQVGFVDVATESPYTDYNEVGGLSRNFEQTAAATQNGPKRLRGLTDDLIETESKSDANIDPAPAPAAKPAPANEFAKRESPQPNRTLLEFPEFETATIPFSTFSLNVSDNSYRLAESYLARQTLPPPGTMRAEEFINAFDYGDATPSMARKIGFAWDRARWPFAHDRDVLRFSIQTAALGRSSQQPLRITLAIDASGSMARPDRSEIVSSLIDALKSNFGPDDRISLVTFDRAPRLALDGVAIDDDVSLESAAKTINPQGGTDIESGLQLAYETARRHYSEAAINRVILVTDGAANLGNTEAAELTRSVEENRKMGIALDCFGVGFDGHDDAFLETLSRHGDGRYRFLRSVEDARVELGEKLAGTLRPAAHDVKVQVEFNPERVAAYQQIGYQQHQLRTEDFRDNTVDAAELSAAEAGTALYLIRTDPAGRGDLGTVRVRFRDAGTGGYTELSWILRYDSNSAALDQASPALRLAAVAAAFAAKVNGSPIAESIDYRDLYELSRPLSNAFPNQRRVILLPSLIDQARRISGQP